MVNFIIIQIYLLLGILYSAGHDATSYLLKEKKDDPLTSGRIKRWHRDGAIIGVLFLLPIIFNLHNFKLYPQLHWVIISFVLLRLSFFDLGFNKWAGLKITYLGGTPWIDRQFIKIFGINGAIKKSVTFFILLVGVNILKIYL